MPPPLPRTLVEYPWVVVTVSCKLCSRRGRYRLARLAARYGPDQSLDGLLADLAHDCPYWRSKPRNYEARCGARFEDLDRPRPADLVGSVASRPRDPPRESLTQRRPKPSAPAGRGPTLATWPHELIAVLCVKCGRRDAYVTADLLATEGDALLTTLRSTLTGDCPRAQRAEVSDWCGARLGRGERAHTNITPMVRKPN